METLRSNVTNKSKKEKRSESNFFRRPKPTIKNNAVHFTTGRQELLTKPEIPAKVKKDQVQTTECNWGEPFVLYYEDKSEMQEDSDDENKLKFAIQMGFDELVNKKRGGVVRTEHLVGEQESF